MGRSSCKAPLFLGASAVAAAFASTLASVAEAQSPPAAPTTIAVGDWTLAPTLEVRSRGEYWRDPVDIGGGQDVTTGQPGASPRVRDAGGILERTRLGIDAERGALKAQLTFQDAHVWGTAPVTGALGQGTSNFASFQAFEAYFEAHSMAARPNYIRVGRQVVAWGEGRLLGASDWSPTARSLDAARAHLAAGNFDFELLGAVLEPARPIGTDATDVLGPASAGNQLYGAMIDWTLDPLFALQAYALAKISRSNSGPTFDTRAFGPARAVGETYTGALRAYGDSKGWNYGAEFAYQLGHVDNLDVNGEDRQAYAAAAHISKTLDKVSLSPTLRLGGSYATGDDGHGTYKQFDPILPDVHAFYGAMDIFSWSNILEGNARLTVVPATDTTLAVEYRYAQMLEAGGEWLNGYLASVGRGNGSSNTSHELGHEIDGVFTWLPWTSFELAMGYSVFLAGDGARTVLAAEGRGGHEANGTYDPVGVTHFGYLQATLRIP